MWWSLLGLPCIYLFFFFFFWDCAVGNWSIDKQGILTEAEPSRWSGTWLRRSTLLASLGFLLLLSWANPPPAPRVIPLLVLCYLLPFTYSKNVTGAFYQRGEGSLPYVSLLHSNANFSEVLFLTNNWYAFGFSLKFWFTKQILLTFSIHELKAEPF